jgi:polysaccharide deacetylase 2 family uncharacterized protein YibQ
LPHDLTIAVLPGLAYSAQSAEKARNAGKEVILHQPMQAVNLSTNPGPKSIQPDMSSSQIRALLTENIREVGPVAGMNNHEGSLITADINAMNTILSFCKEKSLYFLDSRTNSETKASLAALELNTKVWERNIFLDNTQNRQDIIEMYNKGLKFADKNGMVIMIGHIWSGNNLASILDELYDSSISKGYEFRTINSLVKTGQ